MSNKAGRTDDEHRLVLVHPVRLREVEHAWTVDSPPLLSAMSCGLVAVAIGPVALTAAPASATSCTAIPDTSFSIDGITNLNAAVVNPTTTVSGMVDATGCDVGVYFGPGTSGSVGGAIVENATMVDVVNNGGTVSITDSTVNQIGDNPLDGVQYGIGIYFGPSSATGLILGKGSRRV